MKNIFLIAAMTMIATGCVEEVQQNPPAAAVSDVRSDESVETVHKGRVLIDRAGEESTQLMDLTEISFTDEIRKRNSFTVHMNRTDFEKVRSTICEHEPFVQENKGEIMIQQMVEKVESPYIRVRFPDKKATKVVTP